MLDRFKGQEGRRRIVEVFANQELVLQNLDLAQKLADASKLKEFNEQQELYIAGQPGNNKLYFIVSGSFDLLIKGVSVAVMKPGQALGEFPIVDPSLTYTVTIRAREPSVVAIIPESQILSIAEQFPVIWKNMAKMLIARLHETHEHISAPRKPCVFIGHGRSSIWARVQLFLEHDCHLQVVSYESEPRAGESIVPVLEDMLGKATFAVLVLTAEDETSEGGKRARQNVVHEAGLFQGVLGFHRAILLIQKGLEEFSNVHGLQHISFVGEKVDQTFFELQRVLKREQQIS
jgi:predicted nucleotide-binding protein